MKHFGRVSGMRPMLRRGATLLCAAALLSTAFIAYPSALAQTQTAPAAKRALTHQDYDSWRSIVSSQVSRDGKFVAYAYVPEDGDGEIVVRSIATGVDWRAPRGYRPPVPPPDDSLPNAAELIAEQARLLRPVFTADSRFLIFGTEPAKTELNKAKKDKRKPEDMPKNGLSIMDLSNGTVMRIERVKTFRVPEDGSGFIAYLLEPAAEEKPAQQNPSDPVTPTPRTARSSRKKEYGSDLVLRNTATGKERRFSDVLDFTISKDARTLVFATSAKKEETNGIFFLNTDS